MLPLLPSLLPLLLLPLLLLALPQSSVLAAESEPGTPTWRMETSGYLGLRGMQQENRSNAHTNSLAATALITSRLKRDHDSLTLQLRPAHSHTRPPGSGKTSANVDELYWERQLSPVFFAFAGRKKIVHGVATGRNPSDFFNQTKPQDRTLGDADRRAEIKGDNVAGFSWFGSDYSVQSLMAAPEKNNSRNSKRVRALVQASTNINALSADVSFSAYYADRPALGMNFSAVAGENTVLYAEAAVHKGRDRPAPKLSAQGVMIGTGNNTRRWFANLVAGSQTTLGNGMTLTAEYWRNEHSFSNREQAGIAKTLTSGQGNPRLAGNLLGSPGLRVNSVFARMGDIPLSEAVKGEITWIHNLDDASHLLRSAIHWDAGETHSLRLGVDWFSGNPSSEYGSSRTRRRIFLHYKNYF